MLGQNLGTRDTDRTLATVTFREGPFENVN